MDFYSFTPIAAALDAGYQFLLTLGALLAPFGGTASAALAVVALTLLVRTVLIPVGISQVRAEIARRRLSPKLAELQRRYKNNRELLARKTMELYTSERVSPLAGVGPLLLQAPVLSLVYGLFIVPVINGHPNTLLTEQLFGVELGTSLASVLGSGTVWPAPAVFLALLVVIAMVAGVSRRVALRTAMPIADDATPATRRLASSLTWLPFLTVAFAAFVPLAAAIYLATTTLWTLIERTVLRRALL